MKKTLAILCCVALIACMFAMPAFAEETVTANAPYKIALITMDSVDQHWVSLKEGAQAEADADGVTVDFMSGCEG